MAAKKKSWREKLADSKDLPKVVKIGGKMSKRWGEGTCALPAPMEVDELMRAVPKGRITTIDQIRAQLAQKHHATLACPMVTGIFAWIAANAADEAEREGAKRITPYWRTLKAKGELNPKYPDGVKNLATRLRGEGHKIVQKGKRYFVANYESALA
jgi:6-O-methylguanine DNA methyltransferase, DNA binding domain